MKKLTISLLIICLITILVSSISMVTPDQFFTSTIFTVSGIMFSIGFGLIVSFNLNGVKNKNYIKELRENINFVRNNFMTYFLLATTCYILDQYFNSVSFTIIDKLNIKITFCLSIFFCLFILYSVCYFITNFIEIQKLNNDIFDKINTEK